jgi:lipopolysaccharide biosynthesis glycosyltransferase
MIIACTIDDNYIMHCAIMLKSLHDANPQEDLNVYIVHGKLNTSKRAALAAYLGRFLPSVSFIQVGSDLLHGLPVHGQHLSIAVYLRLVLPAVLPAGVNRVIFMDSDIIVADSLRGLWDLSLGESPIGAVIDHSQEFNCGRLGLENGAHYFNAGLLLIDLKRWRSMDVMSNGLTFARENEDLVRLNDQDVLNHLFQFQWLHLHPRWNALPHLWGLTPAHEVAGTVLTDLDREARDHPAVIHFAGAGASKPWNFFCTHPWKDRYLHLKSQTPWADVPLDDQPLPAILQWWNQSLFRTKCALREGFRRLGLSQ